MAFVVVIFFFFFFLHFLQTTDLYKTTCGDMASDRTHQFHIRTAKQVVDAALGEISPEDAEKLWVSLVQSKIVAQQNNHEAIDFKPSSRCACRMLQERRTLGIVNLCKPSRVKPSTEPRPELSVTGVGDSLLLPLFSLSKRLSPTPRVSNLSLRPGRYLSTVTLSSGRGSVDGFTREGLQTLATFKRLSQ